MAPRYMGSHLEQQCEECGCLCRFYAPQVLPAVPCPNCGFKIPIASAATVPGEVVLVAQHSRPPERWMTVAFDHPEKPAAENHISIKRVVGLPGEAIEIRNGDVFADDQIQSKSWDKQLEMSLLVHDTNFLPRKANSNNLAKGWQLDSHANGWQLRGSCWEFDSNQGHGRIEFQNVASFRRAGGDDSRSMLPVQDDRPFDPAESRNLQRVDDLLLTAKLANRAAKFSIEFRLTEPGLNVLFDSKAQSVVAKIADRELAVGTWNQSSTSVQLGVSNFDGVLSVVFDGREVIHVPIAESAPADLAAAGKPLAISGLDGQFELSGLQVRRDVYYLPVLDTSPAEPSLFKLGEREYFVLGDNPIDSVDSRHWKHAGLDAKLILGEVKPK